MVEGWESEGETVCVCVRERDSRQWEREWEGERGGMEAFKRDRVWDGRE